MRFAKQFVRFFPFVVLFTGLWACASCGPQEPATPSPSAVSAPATPKPLVSEAQRASLTAAILARAGADADLAVAVKHAVRAGLPPAEKDSISPIVAAYYEKAAWALLFARPSKTPSEAEGGAAKLEELVAYLQELPDHALKHLDLYDLPGLAAALPPAEAALAALATAQRAAETDARYGAAWKALAEVREVPDDAGLAKLAETLGVKEAGPDPLAGFVDWVAAASTARAPHVAALAELDWRLTRAVARFHVDFKVLIRADPYEITRSPKAAIAAAEEAIVATLERAQADPVATLKGLEPQLPLYRKTLEGLKRYRALAAAGGFKKLQAPKGMARGAKGDAVTRLKERLQAEGYFNGVLDGTFDADLAQAVKDYQTTHQIDVDGKLSETTLKSLNKPVEERIEAIELSLQRWRDSRIDTTAPFFFRVNLPQFELEVYENGQVVRRHRIVCGNVNIELDEKRKEIGPFNYSRQLQSVIENIVLNPKWRVPDRILMDELELELIADPAYFEHKNYKIEIKPDGSETIAQGEGDDNALGRIKFNFVNPFGIYLHDTPQKPFFERTIRAFSHGCMRVHNATDLGLYVLDKVQGMKADEVQKIWDSLEETPVTLAQKIPVYVEYNTVSIDDQGRMMFFLDVYHYDWAYWNKLLPFAQHMKLNNAEFQSALEAKKKYNNLGRGYFEGLFKKKFHAGTAADGGPRMVAPD